MTDNVQKPKRIQSKNQLRNMRQYKDLSDEEFDKLYAQVVFGVEREQVVQDKFDRIMKQFEDEYDLSEMLPNDRSVLKNLITAIVQLENYETQLMELSRDGINQSNVIVIEKINNMCDTLRKSISSMQNDLGITRKVRKSDKDQSVLNFLEDLKKRAAQFHRLKHNYVFCEKCNQLLATVWFQRPEDKGEKISVTCHKITDGQECGWSKTFTSKELLDMGGSNKKELLPEALR